MLIVCIYDLICNDTSVFTIIYPQPTRPPGLTTPILTCIILLAFTFNPQRLFHSIYCSITSYVHYIGLYSISVQYATEEG